MKRPAYYLPAALFVLLIAYFLRIYALNDYPPGIYYDDGRKLQRAWRIEEGLGLPLYFQDIAEPFDVLIRGVYHKLTGGTRLFTGQNFTIFLNLLSVAALMLAARRLYREHPHVYLISLVAGLVLATMPPLVMIGRHLYRANWLPLAQMLALVFLLSLWQRPKAVFALAAGIMMAVSSMMYTGGLFSPPAFFLVLLFPFLQSRFRWPHFKHIAYMALGFFVTMLPWFYLYFRIPNWLMRVSDLSDQKSPLRDISLLPSHIAITLNSIFFPEPLHDMRYSPYTTAFQHPVFLLCLLLGFALSLWRWRKSWILSPVILFLVMIWPNILSNEPYQPIRLLGIFAPMSLLIAYGIGEILKWAKADIFVKVLILSLFIASPIYTLYHLWYHYTQEPSITDPYLPHSLAWTYRIGYLDLLLNIAESDEASYIPLEYLNTDLAVAVLRPDYFPNIRAYNGEILPSGRVILPINSLSFGFFFLEHTPMQYALLLPESGEIVILPPLELEEASHFEQRIRSEGQDILNEDAWILGQSLALDAENPFQDLRLWQANEVLAVFDDNLELVGIDAPLEIEPNSLVPVTLYWRLRENTNKDYFSRLQVWDYANNSQGYELRAAIINEADFPLNIHYNSFPTVMWEAGEIVADVRWLPVFESAPEGAYRFALAVFDYPGPSPVAYETSFGLAESQDIWVLLGRSAIERSQYLDVISQPSTEIVFGNHYELLAIEAEPAINQLAAGDTFSLALSWHVLALTSRNYTQFVHVLDANGSIIGQADSPSFNGIFPTWAWNLGDTLTTHIEIQIASDALAPFSVNTGFYDYPSLERLAVYQNGIALPDNILHLP